MRTCRANVFNDDEAGVFYKELLKKHELYPLGAEKEEKTQKRDYLFFFVLAQIEKN